MNSFERFGRSEAHEDTFWFKSCIRSGHAEMKFNYSFVIISPYSHSKSRKLSMSDGGRSCLESGFQSASCTKSGNRIACFCLSLLSSHSTNQICVDEVLPDLRVRSGLGVACDQRHSPKSRDNWRKRGLCMGLKRHLILELVACG